MSVLHGGGVKSLRSILHVVLIRVGTSITDDDDDDDGG